MLLDMHRSELQEALCQVQVLAVCMQSTFSIFRFRRLFLFENSQSRCNFQTSIFANDWRAMRLLYSEVDEVILYMCSSLYTLFEWLF